MRKLIILSLLFTGACKSATETEPWAKGKTEEQIASIKKGKAIYVANCIACHNPNPKLDGPLGPSIAGASRELLEARVLFAKYPEGYSPKRPTQAMVALPHLKSDLPTLYEFLNSEAY